MGKAAPEPGLRSASHDAGSRRRRHSFTTAPLSLLAIGWCRRVPTSLNFWLSFLLLHVLLFLPVVLMDREDGSILPTVNFAGQAPLQVWGQLFIWRRGPDLFRFSSEIILLVALWATVGPLRRTAFRIAFVAFYLLLFLYYIYEGSSLTFFSVEPVFYGQLRMATEGVSFFLQNAGMTTAFVVGTMLLISGGAFVVARLSRSVFPEKGPGRTTRAVLILLSILVVGQALFNSENLYRPEMVFSSITAKLTRNVDASQQMYGEVQRLENVEISMSEEDQGYALIQRPPIYIIFLESYGTVLYKRSDWRARFRTLTDRLEQKLSSRGWHAASALSLAPTWGGGSWMSYTSALFGLRVSSDPQYYALLDKYESGGYPDLGSFLKEQGYQYFRLTALSMGLPQEQWKKYETFYGVDRWLQYADLNYVGPEYGWGPAPPDQFSLNYARETIKSEASGPYLFFTITQNSHYPWTPLPELVDSWQTLNRPGTNPPPSSELIEHSERRQNYWNAIEYQLELLTDFVLSEPNEDAIIVIMGDHQPPRVSRREDGWDTPMHVIAKDGNFIASFEDYGFTKGLAVWEPEPTFRHEGFRSLFVRLLLAAYGEGETLPPYLPGGVSLEERPGPDQTPH